MARHVPLNNIEHQALRIITKRSVAYGDNQMFALTFPAEFRSVQCCYPIVFQKRSDTGQFQPLALFGFQAGENLFLTESGWDATYVPISVERLPFLIEFRKRFEKYLKGLFQKFRGLDQFKFVMNIE